MIKKYLLYALFPPLLLFIMHSSAFPQNGFVESIYFEPNSFSIGKKYETTLNLIAKQLSSDTFGYLKIIGYADTNGSENYNDVISGKRANAVYNYLCPRVKFDTTRVHVTWIGESADIYDLHFQRAHRQRRCVDIWIQFYKKPK